MLAYLVRRLLGAIPLLLGILTLIFFVLQLAPGDPIAKFANPNVSPEVLEQMRRNFGLDRPLHEQYGKWLWSFVTGDFGYSFGQMRPINEILPGILWNTVQLTLISLVVIFAVGMLIGIVQAVRQYSIADNVLTFLALFFYSMPSFWFALMLILIFSLRAGQEGWALSFPASGMTSIDYEYLTGGEKFRDRVMHLILPAIALGIGSAAGVARPVKARSARISPTTGANLKPWPLKPPA